MRIVVSALLTCLLLVGGLAQTSHAAEQELPIIVLIMDDLGNNRELGMRALRLPGDITFGILPLTPNAQTLAHHAHSSGKEVIVHTPMTSVHRFDPGPGTLSADLGHSEFLATLRGNIKAVPHARGLNNHMGSDLTQQTQFMGMLMAIVAEQSLYFIDSRTSVNTVAASVAEHFQIRHLSRDVFIDHEPDQASMQAEFQRMLTLARRKGIAVATAHPRPATLQFLEAVLPDLQANEQVRLLRGSDAITARSLQMANKQSLVANGSNEMNTHVNGGE